jgi:glycosyltransferase involved in cell wall biosynthesis
MLPDVDWQVVCLPPRHFAWRVRGNAFSWAFSSAREVLEQPYDAILATSVCDLAGLRAFVPSLGRCPAWVYVHENQFAYPSGQDDRQWVEPAMMSLSTLLAADRISFNSAYNRDTLLQGAEDLLRRMPDYRPLACLQQIAQRSEVLPVAIPDACFMSGEPQPGRLRVVWNHRWEYDKAPERLLQALRLLRASGERLHLALLGQAFRQVPQAILQIQQEFADDLWRSAPEADESAYRQLLAQADVVVSTALHDFQGLAVLEAMAASCLACVPDRLAYPEFVPQQQLYRGSETHAEKDASALADALVKLCQAKRGGLLAEPTPPRALRCSQQQANWQRGLDALLAGQ